MLRGATFRDVLRLAARAAGLITVGLIIAQGRGQTVISGTYNGVTIEGDISVAANTSAYFTNGTTFTGTNATIGKNAQLSWAQNGTLDGKAISMEGGSIVANSLTLGPSTTVSGQINIRSGAANFDALLNRGTINHTSGSGVLFASGFSNSGNITASSSSNLTIGTISKGDPIINASGATITADGSGTIVYLDGSLTNQGTLVARNSGQLFFRNGFFAATTTPNLGTVTLVNGGHAYLAGTIDNTGATLNAPTGGSFELYGGTIKNGSIAEGAVTFTNQGGTLDNLVLTGNLILPAGASVGLTGGTTFSGTEVRLGDSAGLGFSGQTFPLDGKQIVFGANSQLSMGSSLTFGPTTTATGNVNITSFSLVSLVNQGTITHTGGIGGFTGRMVLNSGTITASAGSFTFGHYYSLPTSQTNGPGGSIISDGAGTIVYLEDSVVNLGTLIARNSGQIIFQNGGINGQPFPEIPSPSANLGRIQIESGGHVYLTGIIDNTSATIAAPSGGMFELSRGKISNGTISGGALGFTSMGGTLSNVTLADNLTLQKGSSVTFINGTTFTGDTATFGQNSRLVWWQMGSLLGKTLNFAAGSTLDIYSPVSASASLTLGPTTTVTGTVKITDNLGTGMVLNNQGTITHTAGTGSLAVDALTNTGSITATSGSLEVGNYDYTTTNGRGGTIVADGPNSIVSLYGVMDNQGTLIARNSGQLVFRNAYPVQTTATLGMVQIAAGGHVYLGGALNNTSSILTPPTGGRFELYGGTIFLGAIAEGALAFTSAGGMLSNVALTGNFDLQPGAAVTFIDGTVFSGSTATLGSNSSWRLAQSGTLSDKLIAFGTGAEIYLQGKGTQLTLGPTTSVTGSVKIRSDSIYDFPVVFTNQGAILHNSGSGSIGANAFSNTGNITVTSGSLTIGGQYYPGYTTTNGAGGMIIADGPSATITLDGPTINQGTLIVRNSGQIVFRTLANAGQTSATLGTIQIASGGHVYLSGNLDNLGTTLTAPSGGSYELYGGTINNGSIAPGALSFTSNGGVLNNVSLGELSLPANTKVTLTNGTTLGGSAATLGDNSTLLWQQNGTLDAKAITSGNGAVLQLTGANRTLTLGATSSLTGDILIFHDFSGGSTFSNQGAIVHNNDNGSIGANTFSNAGRITATSGSYLTLGRPDSGYRTTNTSSGIITADGATIYLEGNIINQGTLVAQNGGSLMIRSGYFTSEPTSNLGTVQIASGGHAYLNGFIDNTGATLHSPTGGQFELYGGTILNGSVDSGALAYASFRGTLNKVSIVGDFNLTPNGQVTFTNGTSFSGANATLGASSTLWWEQAGSLVDKTITMGSGSTVALNGFTHALTLSPSTTVTGSIHIFPIFNAGTVTNQGAITHTDSGTGQLFASPFTNSGSIIVSSGVVLLGSNSFTTSVANTSGGLIRTTGDGRLDLQAPDTTQIFNNGTIDVRSGTLTTNNHLTNSAGGVISGAGTIVGNVSAAGGTLAPGNSIGTLTFQNGTLNVTGASVFAVELGGASSDQLLFVNPPSAVSLGTGLLTLSLTLLAPPTEGTTYNLIRISSGGSGITGTFAGLPASGNTISAVYSDTTYTFGVNYAPNLVSLNFAAVPEPSTYALIALGGAMLAIARWRRRG